MTDDDRKLVERLRNGFIYKKTCHEAAERIEALTAEVERCHARLEIDHMWQANDTDPMLSVCVDVPMEERSSVPDAVRCRDATIQLLEGQIVTARADALREAAELVEAAPETCGFEAYAVVVKLLAAGIRAMAQKNPERGGLDGAATLGED